MNYGELGKWTRFAIQNANSGRWITLCRDGWALVDQLEDTDLYRRRGEAEARLQDFRNWLKSQFPIYSGDYWSSCSGGANAVVELAVTFTDAEYDRRLTEQYAINHCEVCGPQFDRLEGNRCEKHK